jgi:hypothetical protein
MQKIPHLDLLKAKHKKIFEWLIILGCLFCFIFLYFQIETLIFDDDISRFVITSLSILSSGIISYYVFKYINFYVLSKINADHLLIRLNLDRGKLRDIAKNDIKKNGYFSANGYWSCFKRNQSYDKNRIEIKARKIERESIRTKYPMIFNDKSES